MCELILKLIKTENYPSPSSWIQIGQTASESQALCFKFSLSYLKFLVGQTTLVYEQQVQPVFVIERLNP